MPIKAQFRTFMVPLRMLAESLDFQVVFRRTNQMKANDWSGLMVPDTQKIYVDPNVKDPVETLAHEIGHVLMMFTCLEHGESDSLSDDISENAADLIGRALCLCVGYDPDGYPTAAQKLAYTIAKNDTRLTDDKFQAYLAGYMDCLKAMAVRSDTRIDSRMILQKILKKNLKTKEEKDDPKVSPPRKRPPQPCRPGKF